MSLVTGPFFLVLLLNQRWSPPLRLQASHCSTFRNMCDVPSIAVFCSESIECFPGTVSKFFLKLLVTIPVALIITGTIVHFRLHIRCISIHYYYYYYYYYYHYYYSFFTFGEQGISVHSNSLLAGQFAVWTQWRQDIFSSSHTSWPALEPTKFPVQWVPGINKNWGVALNIRFHWRQG